MSVPRRDPHSGWTSYPGRLFSRNSEVLLLLCHGQDIRLPEITCPLGFTDRLDTTKAGVASPNMGRMKLARKEAASPAS